MSVEAPSVITGMPSVSKDGYKSVFVDIYGEAFKDQPDPTEEVSTIVFTVKNGATWSVNLPALYDMVLNTKSTFLIEGNGELILDGEGWLDINGTLTNKGKFTNNSNVYNDSANTLDNQGELINNGLILNDSASPRPEGKRLRIPQ